MIRIFFTVLLIAITSVATAAVNAEVDRTQIGEGEPLTLTLSSDSSNSQPDLSILNANFDVLGTTQNKNISIFNGSMSSQSAWTIQLAPKQIGTIIIPAITMGKEKTAPITIEVTKQSSTNNAASNNTNTSQQKNDMFFETSTDKHEVYVQGQIIYTQRFSYRSETPEFDNIPVEPPTIEGGSIESLNTKGPNYRQEINGTPYQIMEATYAIFPEKSGQLHIPAQTIKLQMRTSMFEPPRVIRLHSEEIIINVLPQPNKTQPWLPAKDLKINQEWSTTSPIFKVGESVTRKIIITAEGLNQSQLPTLPDIKVDGLKMYVDKPETKNNIASGGKGIVGVRTDSVAIVATKPGTYTLPPINIKWWNTDSNKEETASLPAFTFTVENNPNNKSALPAPAVGTTANPTSAPVSPETPNTHLTNQPWLYVAGAFCVLWMITLLLWWRAQHQSKKSNAANVIESNISKLDKSQKSAFDELIQACQNNDAAKAREALLTWAQEHWSTSSVLTLEDITLKAPSLSNEINLLEHALYSNQTGAWQGSTLLTLIKQLPRVATNRTKEKSPLASLYPSK